MGHCMPATDRQWKDPAAATSAFTDGACSGNPGPGRLGVHPRASSERPHDRRSSGAEPDTTNNRMELIGVIEGLVDPQAPLPGRGDHRQPVRGQGDQRVDAELEAPGMEAEGGAHLKPVSNVDLWQKVDALLAIHRVQVTHVLGHRGHPENEACDRMAVEAYKRLKEELSS